MSKYVSEFDPHAPNDTAAAIYRLARSGGKRVLDIGSGPAPVSRVLATGDGRDVTCVDADPAGLAELGKAGIGKAIEADVSGRGWPSLPPDKRRRHPRRGPEHLFRPQDLLATITGEGVIAPDGLLVVSVPNAAHESVIADLLSGRLDYAAAGPLEEHHVRWFTRDSITTLLETTGYVVTQVHRTIADGEPSGQVHRKPRFPDAVAQALRALGDDARTDRYILAARPASDPARLAALHEEIGESRRKIHRRYRKAVVRARDAEAEVLRLSEQLRQARAARTSLEQKVRDLRASRTYRAGAALRKLAKPAAALRRRIKPT